MFSVLRFLLLQPRSERSERLPAMCDGELLRVTDIRERPLVRRVVEDRVVPEAMVPRRRVADLPLNPARRLEHDAVVTDDGHRTDEPRRAGTVGALRQNAVD